jgi:hypothetical protein
MEKIFSINKWSVGLCALIIAAFGAMQFAGSEHLLAVASLAGEHIFSWQWQGAGRAHAVIYKAEVMKKSDTDAVVRVMAHETIEQEAAGKFIAKRPEIACSAKLTFYRADKEWILARVEYE